MSQHRLRPSIIIFSIPDSHSCRIALQTYNPLKMNVIATIMNLKISAITWRRMVIESMKRKDSMTEEKYVI